MPNAGKRTLLPSVGVVLPRLAVEPSIVPGTAFGAVFTVLVNHRRATDDAFESVRLPLRKTSHFAAIAVTHQRELVRIDGVVGDDSIDSSHNVPEIRASEVILIGGGKCSAISGAATRVGPQNRPAMPQQKRDKRRIAVLPGPSRPAMHVHDQGHLAVLSLGRQIEKPLN